MELENPYLESMRYIDNAKEQLKFAGKEDKFYKDEKYVKIACGAAYSGILKALDFYFNFKGVPKRRGRKSIIYYQSELSKLDKKLLNHLNSAYLVLHLDGYYSGLKKIDTIESGFDAAVSIIAALKPLSKNGAKRKS
ncbi:MAG: hypothetical protein A2X61_13760 [Ignavibacteria bacterium GWB2_35_12]|nr:MAG: hypothetical protein A2X63_09545 [Ignavibacteria bacterium GWA2_35_8]OGU41181.1 MAG: hypothetical protein A2X61_13760 [Ignavibacteria bacterium GWB2_35_12]OGU86812.1 MAG: hypothetical protein A2220_09110 [Ignavibacteria bacterium RIFOXYA2_FULL_35_10]OGV23103.1 MAG: hypothetical protein A2475_17090 [Ignavibacteria bacterium RIFOXYC2_FULL_35_21]